MTTSLASLSAVDYRVGDALDVLRAMPAESVHCVVTSPPYWGLRSYGGRAGEIGLEESLSDYLGRLVPIFAEVHRVLRRDGTLWLNVGDSWAGSMGSRGRQGKGGLLAGRSLVARRQIAAGQSTVRTRAGFTPKTLIGVPWRLAFALSDAGWTLRSHIVWHKPNPIVSSVKDRPTNSHEDLFLFAKAREYYYDSYAVRTPLRDKTRTTHGTRRKVIEDPTGLSSAARISSTMPLSIAQTDSDGFIVGAQLRDVWTIATQRDDTPHPAKFPPKLAERCILLGTSARGACSSCGKQWRRQVVECGPDLEWQKASGGDAQGEYRGEARWDRSGTGATNPSELKRRVLAGMKQKLTRGWQASCSCVGAEVVPPIVLDPFAGSGTTLMVALQNCRRAIGIDLSPEYAAIARTRILREVPPILLAASRPAQ